MLLFSSIVLLIVIADFLGYLDRLRARLFPYHSPPKDNINITRK
jgi:hypothetical protein